MKADAKTVSEILGGPNQYFVPFFQRYYSWKHKQWERLWNDVLFLLGEGKGGQHFLGPLVVTPFEPGPSEIHRFQLIDGQQRLTTLSLLLAAIRDVAIDKDHKGLAEGVHEDYLIQKRQDSDLRYRVVPRSGDREAFFHIMDKDAARASKKLGVTKAYLFFRRRASEWLEEVPERDLKHLRHAVLALLNLVTISIDGENPYEIFESLNSTGLPLEEADLVRNYVFMLLPTERQEAFQHKYWKRIEDLFASSSALPPKIGTLFYRNYLMRNGRYIERTGTFVTFKDEHKKSEKPPEALAEDIHRFATYEIMFRLPERADDVSLRRSLRRIESLDVKTAHPLLMNLMARFEREEIERKELLGCFDDLASFVLRRSLCGESSRGYGRWFTEAIESIAAHPREDLQKIWHRRGWPGDEMFAARLLEFPIYHRERRKARLVLQEIEDSYGHKEKIDPATLTVEHVMPQTIGSNKSGNAWKGMLGPEWASTHESWLHTLGNLTLTGYNPDMSNKPFDKKKTALRNSNLELNRGFGRLQIWNEAAIHKRGSELAAMVVKLFPKPQGGLSYTATAEAVRDLEDDVTSGEKRRAAYWSRLNGTLRDQESKFALESTGAGPRQEFPLPWKRVQLVVAARANLREIRVRLSFVWKTGKKLYQGLLADRERIDAELDGEATWLDKGKLSVQVVQTDVDVKNEDDWDDQQDWIVEKLEAFDSVLLTRVAKLMEDVDPGE